MELSALSVKDFIRETGSNSPAPGGGSIAALNAASGAALIAMVANLTIGKEKYSDVQDEMKAIAEKATALYEEFLTLIDEDSQAFNQYMAALKLPKETEEEKAARSAALQEGLKVAAKVPFGVGQLAVQLLDLADEVIQKGNTNAITDGAVAAMNARIAIKGAFLNVKINLGGIKDESFVEKLVADMKAIEDKLDAKEVELLGKTGL